MAYARTLPRLAVGVIYCLELEGGKYYVGRTPYQRRRRHKLWMVSPGQYGGARKRLEAHVSREGAAWTEKYPPVDYERVELKLQEGHQYNITLEMMAIHGVANVRGGKWCQLRLPEATYRDLVKKTSKMSSGPCDRCGRQTHGRAKCYASTTIDGVKITTKSWVYRPLKAKAKPKVKPKAKKAKAGPRLSHAEKYALNVGRKIYGSTRAKSVKWMKSNLPYYELLKDRYQRGV